MNQHKRMKRVSERAFSRWQPRPGRWEIFVQPIRLVHNGVTIPHTATRTSSNALKISGVLPSPWLKRSPWRVTLYVFDEGTFTTIDDLLVVENKGRMISTINEALP